MMACECMLVRPQFSVADRHKESTVLENAVYRVVDSFKENTRDRLIKTGRTRQLGTTMSLRMFRSHLSRFVKLWSRECVRVVQW